MQRRSLAVVTVIPQFSILALFLLLFSVLPQIWAEETPPPDLSQLPGHREIQFDNGKTARGEILSVEKDKFRFKPYDGEAFVIPLSLIDSARELLPAEIISEQSRVLASNGKLDEAVKLLSPAFDSEKYPEAAEGTDLGSQLRGELGDYRARIKRARDKVKDSRRAPYSEKFNTLVDRRAWPEALELAKQELKLYPNDIELIEDVVTMQYRIHRSSAKHADEFRSFDMDKLKKLEPENSTLLGIEGEMAVATRLKGQWEADREEFLANAMDRAQAHYKEFRLDQARDVLRQALAYNPPSDQAVAFRNLLAKVEAEIAAEKADMTDAERKRLRELRGRYGADGKSSDLMSDKEFEQEKQRMWRRAGGANPKKVYQRTRKK